MCIRDSDKVVVVAPGGNDSLILDLRTGATTSLLGVPARQPNRTTPHYIAVSYTHLRAHETVLDLVCRLLLEKKKSRTLVAVILLHVRRREIQLN